MGLRDKFLARAATRTLKRLDIDFDGESLWIRPMKKATRSRMESIASGERKPKDCSDIRWVVLRDCLCSESGETLLTDDDRPHFDQWDDSFIEPIFDAILKHSRVTDQDKEDLEKN